MNSSGETLSRSVIFGGLPVELIQRLEKSGRMENFGKDEFVFLEGDKGDRFFFLIEGLVRVYKAADNDREVVLRHIRPGEMFGEVILFDSPVYPVNAVAQRESIVFSIRRSAFIELLQEESFMKFFVGNLFKKMRHLTDRIAFLNAYDVEERFFVFIEEHYGLKPEVQVDLSKAELAEAIGTIPETISRMIARLKTRGVINWEKNELKINVEYAKSVIEKLKVE
jgi:CRP/FNR family transcriptional regulator